VKSRRGRAVLIAAVSLACITVALHDVATAAGAAPAARCPLAALRRADAPVHITMWHSAVRVNEQTLQELTDEFNASQHQVTVDLVNEVEYSQTLAKLKAGLATGDLPDVVQIQDTDQQQMIDSGVVLPASACAAADHYSFADFLPRVTSYYNAGGTQYAMPFNVSGPVLYYNRTAFRAAGLDPDAPPKTLSEVRSAAQALQRTGVATPLGLRTDPGLVEQWTATAGGLYVDQQNGRPRRATKAVFDTADGRRLFAWMSAMVDDGLAATNPDVGTGDSDDLLGIASGAHAMAFDTSADLGTVMAGVGAFPNVEVGVAPLPGPPTSSPSTPGGVTVSGGALYMLNRSAPAKQAAAWKFLKFLDRADNVATWAIHTGYVPIRRSSANSAEMQAFWAQHPEYEVAYDQLANGPSTSATAGALIGNYAGVRDAVRDAENRMFLEGQSPRDALAAAARDATRAIADYDDRLAN